MNHSKPAWYEEAKGGPFRELVFTAEMKQEVRHKIQQNRGKKAYFGWATAVSLALCLSILFVVFRPDDNSSAATGEGTEEIKLDYHYAVKTPADFSDDGFMSVKLQRVTESSVIVKEKVEFKGVGNFLSYIKSPDDQQPFFGVEVTDGPGSTTGEFYEIGPGYMTNVAIEKSNAFGKSYIRLSGECRPNECFYSLWMFFEDGGYTSDFHLDLPSYEADLDGDGITEVVVSTQHPGRVYIYKKIRDRIEYSTLAPALALQAGPFESVVYDPNKNVFLVHSGDEVRSYQYASGQDKLIRVD